MKRTTSLRSHAITATFAAALFAGSAFAEEGGSVPQTARYLGWVESDDAVVINLPERGSTEGMVGNTDSGEYTRFCPEDSDFFCFRNSNDAFAVPRKLPATSQWTHDEITCRVVERDITVSLFARVLFHVDHIRCKAPEVAERAYLHSRSHGIVALRLSEKSGAGAYWLEGNRGVGVLDP